jgi:hypothetical protein
MADKRNALMGEMRATPRNALMGTVADALGAVDRFANMPDKEDPKRKANALLSFLSSGLGVGDLAATADRMSYGHDLTRGKGLATQMLPETAGALMAAGPIAAKYPMQTAKLAMGAMNGGADAAMGAERAAYVYAPNATSAQHLKAVMQEMQTKGAPEIRAYWDGEKYVALEGSHRLAAASKLGMTPKIVEMSPKQWLTNHDFQDLPAKTSVARALSYLDGGRVPWRFDELKAP